MESVQGGDMHGSEYMKRYAICGNKDVTLRGCEEKGPFSERMSVIFMMSGAGLPSASSLE